MITVLMTAYNASRYLASAIESVLAQTHRDFELIVIDDGSKDDTLAIARQYEQKDARVRVITHANMGMGPSLNKGMTLARGEWIARLDADDLMMPNRLERQLQFLQENPGVSVASSLVHYINETDQIIGQCKTPFTQVEVARQYARDNKLIGFNHPAVIMKKSVILEVGGYRKEYWPSDDLDLWNRVAEKGHDILVQGECLTKYRIHGDSICVSSSQLTERKVRFVEHNMKLRRAGQPEMSWEAYQQELGKLPWHVRLKEKRLAMGRTLYKSAVLKFSKRRVLAFVPPLLAAMVLDPLFVIPKVLPRLSRRRAHPAT